MSDTVCMVRMAPAQGLDALYGWFACVGCFVHMYMHKCIVGFYEPKLHAEKFSFNLTGGSA
jgi:hypothetical protein